MGGFSFDAWRDDLFNGTPPVLWPVGDGPLQKFAIGPGRVVLLGGAPCAGKTTLAMQLVFDLLWSTQTLKACVANVEMRPERLIDKALARYAQVDIAAIQSRSFRADQRLVGRIKETVDGMRPLVERIKFVERPHDGAEVVQEAARFGADLLVLDYLQRIVPPTKPGERHRDKRSQVDALMSFVRAVANADKAVLLLSAVGRTGDGRGKAGYAPDRMGLGSFKESGECEYGADDAYILTRNDQCSDLATLHHLKSRYGQTESVALQFEANYQRFVPLVTPARGTAHVKPDARHRL